MNVQGKRVAIVRSNDLENAFGTGVGGLCLFVLLGFLVGRLMGGSVTGGLIGISCVLILAIMGKFERRGSARHRWSSYSAELRTDGVWIQRGTEQARQIPLGQIHRVTCMFETDDGQLESCATYNIARDPWTGVASEEVAEKQSCYGPPGEVVVVLKDSEGNRLGHFILPSRKKTNQFFQALRSLSNQIEFDNLCQAVLVNPGDKTLHGA